VLFKPFQTVQANQAIAPRVVTVGLLCFLIDGPTWLAQWPL